MVGSRGYGFWLLYAAHRQSTSTAARHITKAYFYSTRSRPGALIAKTRRRAMSSNRSSSLWHPSLGIRFAPNESRRSVHLPSSVDGRDGDGLANEAALLTAGAGDGGDADAASDLCELGNAISAIQLQDTHPPPSSTFTMSKELFEAARAAAPGTPESYWTYKLYQRMMPDGALEKVKVHYCTDRATTEQVCRDHFVGHDILGLDLEWCTKVFRDASPRKNVSVIQLATESRIGIFHVAVFPGDDLVAPTFRALIEDAAVKKVGVNILGDCTRLKRHLGVNGRGIYELSHLHKLVKYVAAGTPKLITRTVTPLSVQVEEHMHLPLYKGDTVRTSNWLMPLSMNQIEYAASDAYAGAQLFYILDAKRRKLDPTPPMPHPAELGLPIAYKEPSPSPSPKLEVQLSRVLMRRPRTASPRSSLRLLSPASSSEPKERDARVVAAEQFVLEHRSSSPSTAAPSALRAYHIWHTNQDLDPESIAKLLRDPPLKTTTVRSYILSAISVGRLPFDKDRLRTDILSTLPPKMIHGVYWPLYKACGFQTSGLAPQDTN
ncbi:hypothetical protein L249_6244 [Ophiocordyceps polyrhachis-furcata BCC 54312]|uniref:3'-5' exonuclease domain-containing protein n=1 Tax=Ophiocordyceps polyrhachis-furcata BCC 54312 TaxID=1330021 RepID=A0A367L189_9HYPO|nr:hypothetical protein L249_6244 [Ophiocordyceps polyrhachis-furcata BCC 54312]